MRANKTVVQKLQSTIELIGSVAVDSGMLWISDPCQIVDQHHGIKREPLFEDWSDFLAATGLSRENLTKLISNASDLVTEPTPEFELPEFTLHHKETCSEPVGISIATPSGDGLYDVFAVRHASGTLEGIFVSTTNLDIDEMDGVLQANNKVPQA
jgi:hypothetical protein